MVNLRRKAYDTMLEWKNTSKGRSALVIEGARRVGKSYLAEQFARTQYRSYIIIDFSDVGDDVKGFFLESSEDMDLFFNKLSFRFQTPLYPRDSVIILDEVQFFPYARQKIKKLVADGRFDYIATGSLLSINQFTNNILIPSEEHHITLHPMDFEEFLWALGDETSVPFLRSCFDNRTPIGDSGNRRMMNLFRQYVVVGGMPAAVVTYLESKSFPETDQIKQDILTLYRSDVTKFADGNKTRIEELFDEIPSALSKKEKKIIIASMDDNARTEDFKEAFKWLDDAKIANICYNSTDPTVGLRMYGDRFTMKVYMGDTGLLVTHAMYDREDDGDDFYRDLILDRMNINEGMFMENVVAQMLVAKGIRLYFYSRYDKENWENTMEIDFLIRQGGRICPVEVKSGNRVQHASLDKFMGKFGKRIGQPYVLCRKDVHEKDGILYLPIYMAMFL